MTDETRRDAAAGEHPLERRPLPAQADQAATGEPTDGPVETYGDGGILPETDVSAPDDSHQPEFPDGARGSFRHLTAEENELKTMIGAYRTIERVLAKETSAELGEEEQLELEAIQHALQSEHLRIWKAGLVTLRLRLERHQRCRQHAQKLATKLYLAKVRELREVLATLLRTEQTGEQGALVEECRRLVSVLTAQLD